MRSNFLISAFRLGDNRPAWEFSILETMKATFRVSEADYMKAMSFAVQPTRRQVGALLTAAVVLLVLTVFGPPAVREYASGGLACGLLLIVWVYYILTPILSRRHYRQYKAMHEEFTVELLDEGLRFTSVNSDIRIPWANIIKWRHNETCILIYQMPRLYGVVPKSVAARGFDVALLISRLTEQVGKAS